MSSRFALAGAALIAAMSMGCAAGSAPSMAMGSSVVKAGSMARFIAHAGHLYALNGSELRVYRTTEEGSPEHVTTEHVPADAETLFPYDELLFLGTRQGMLVYSVLVPDQPELIGTAEHLYSCDPVVVQNDIAYVTVRDGNACRAGQNALMIFDVANPADPFEIHTKPLTNPHGLGIDGANLFIADAKDGLLVFDVRDPKNPRLVGKAPDVKGYDVIAHAGILFVSADDGLYQYAYGPDGITRPEPLSRIPIGDPDAVIEPVDETVDQREYAEPPPPMEQAVDPHPVSRE